jgi:hypothetical protein
MASLNWYNFWGFWKGKVMHFYWRIIEELKYLGEILIFHDPSLSRAYKNWVKKNAKALIMDITPTSKIDFSDEHYLKTFTCLN